ncbi:hypothetical protein HFP51_02905 [Parasphingopyxis sp. CP4]|uniref:hypothetical protein n=1 Tax=Parasphingopyxis sp. CP4 TaxID=2724527 RepID=UPI00159FB93D|nr:hypothetical protein [Parasphingopyxis sp. CP4]QLC21227.1 hypothetical protein HFP51_02905 [Parasphingopyxis sp. CP4]
MKLLSIIMSVSVLSACMALAAPDMFADASLEEQQSSNTILSGYVSVGQETSGIYPRPSWELIQGEECVYLSQETIERFNLTQGDYVTLIGQVSRTQCDEPNVICFNVCQKFAIEVQGVR